MPDRIKVLYVIERLARAGTELSLVKILHHIDRTRFEPMLYCLNQEMTDTSLIPPDVPMHFGRAGWRITPFTALRIYRDLSKSLRQIKPDILHSFLFVSNVLGPFAARKTGVQGVVMSRGRMGIEWNAGPLHRFAQSAADCRADFIICKTEAIAEEIRQVEHAAPEKIRFISNGVDTSHYTNDPALKPEAKLALEKNYAIPADRQIILAVGNLKPIKGHISLIEAMPALLNLCPQVHLVIVGDGESRGDLEQSISKLTLDDRVTLSGNISDVRPFLRAADLFAAPSLSEGMPNAVLEAMAMGLPLVLSDIQGHRESAQNIAWYFPIANSPAISAAIAQALSSPDELLHRGLQGLERVNNVFSLQLSIRQIENLYFQIPKNNPSEEGFGLSPSL